MCESFSFDDNADEYDRWFDNNQEIYQSKLLALKQSVPIYKIGLEIGVGNKITFIVILLLIHFWNFRELIKLKPTSFYALINKAFICPLAKSKIYSIRRI